MGRSVITDAERRRILVADDEKDIRDMLELLLSTRLAEYPIDIVVNGAEVVHAFHGVYYGVVLMDVRMPVKNGEEAFNEIREICRRHEWEMPAFVFCTGFDPTPGVLKIVESDPRHCLLRKPLNTDALVDTLRDRLERDG